MARLLAALICSTLVFGPALAGPRASSALQEPALGPILVQEIVVDFHDATAAWLFPMQSNQAAVSMATRTPTSTWRPYEPLNSRFVSRHRSGAAGSPAISVPQTVAVPLPPAVLVGGLVITTVLGRRLLGKRHRPARTFR